MNVECWTGKQQDVDDCHITEREQCTDTTELPEPEYSVSLTRAGNEAEEYDVS